MPQIVELKQDPQFTDRDFEGYKLSIEEIRKSRTKLKSNILRIAPSEEHYTYKHAKLFGLHNHLFPDVDDKLFFVCEDRFIYKSEMNPFGELDGPVPVWKIPSVNPKTEYNVSLVFSGNGFVCVSDGTGLFYIVEAVKSEWKSVFSKTYNYPFVIEDVKFKEDSKELHCLFYNVVIEEGVNKSCLHWENFKLEGKTWVAVESKELKSKGEVYYSKIENNCSGLIIASQHSFVEDPNEAQKLKTYIWTQNFEFLNVKVKADGVICVEHQEGKRVRILSGDKVLLEGELSGGIDSGLTTWEKIDGVVDVCFVKEPSGVMWSEFMVGDENGEHIVDEKLVAEVHSKLAHLCSENEVLSTDTSILNSEMEECDYPTSNTGTIDRITSTKTVAQRSFLGTQTILFHKSLNLYSLPCLAIQQNEDVCLWQPEECENLRHVNTLMALGYIQASKRRRKFITCASDLSYSVICESTRHIFIYRQNKTVSSGELRNRVSGKRVQRIAQQQVVDLTDDEVVGLHAGNGHLFVLTAEMLYVLFM